MPTVPRTTGDVAHAIAAADRLEAEGRFLEAAEILERLPRDDRPPRVDARVVQLRHRGFAQLDPSRCVGVDDALPDEFPSTTSAPEIPADALTTEVLTSALHHHGCLIVRGLLDAETCAAVRSDIDRAFDAFDRRDALPPTDEITPWFARLEWSDGYEDIDPVATAFLRSGGGVYAPTAPRAFVEYRNLLADIGVLRVIEGHLGGTPVLSVNKSVLRRIGGGAEPAWHQDGYYLESPGRAVNLWMALSRCGGETDAMGLDILSGPQAGLAPQGTHSAPHDRAVAQEVVVELSQKTGRPIERPLFEPGDGILFGQYFLHRSDPRPLTRERYAIETWFFTGHRYPEHLIPVVAG